MDTKNMDEFRRAVTEFSEKFLCSPGFLAALEEAAKKRLEDDEAKS